MSSRDGIIKKCDFHDVKIGIMNIQVEQRHHLCPLYADDLHAIIELL